MRTFDLVRSSGDRHPVALSRLLPPVVAAAAIIRVYRSAMVHRIFLYCMVVAIASASITTVLPVAAADRDPKWPSNCSIKDIGAPAL